jgi:hypothetical protein
MCCRVLAYRDLVVPVLCLRGLVPVLVPQRVVIARVVRVHAMLIVVVRGVVSHSASALITAVLAFADLVEIRRHHSR